VNATWTNRDLDIVETLTRRVTLLAIGQIVRIWWPTAGSPRVVRRRLRRLVAAGLIDCRLVNIHPILPLAGPLVSWTPEKPEPDAEAIASSTRARWYTHCEPQEVYLATKLSANLFGSTSNRLPPLEHRDHDLLLAEVYTLYRERRPQEASLWVGEHALSKAGYRVKDPDAFLIDPTGKCCRAIESAGHYDSTRIEEFHQHCFTRNLPYELW
jgi:hypothetical protein